MNRPLLQLSIKFFIFLALFLPLEKLVAQPRKIPPFRIMQANGKVFKAEDLPAGKPVVIIYFSPECDHCQKFMNSFFQKPKDFEHASVVMITYLPAERLAQFNKEHQVQKFPNLFTGTEGTSFFVRNYYNVMQMPFAALHDKNGNFILSYSRDIPLNDLTKKLNALH